MGIPFLEVIIALHKVYVAPANPHPVTANMGCPHLNASFSHVTEATLIGVNVLRVAGHSSTSPKSTARI